MQSKGHTVCYAEDLVYLAEYHSHRLRYRHLTQFEDYKTVNMQIDPATGLYHAIIPGDFIVPEWNLMYFVEALDSLGNGCMIPDMDKEMPYVIVQTEQ